MRTRFAFVVFALALGLALPGFASTARRTVPLNKTHHRRAGSHRPAATHHAHASTAGRAAAGQAGPVRAGTAEAAALRAAAERAPLGVTPLKVTSAGRVPVRRAASGHGSATHLLVEATATGPAATGVAATEQAAAEKADPEQVSRDAAPSEPATAGKADSEQLPSEQAPSERPAIARTSAERTAGKRGALTTHAVAREATIPTLAKLHFVPPLRGSRESLLRQNEKDTAEGLVRIRDDEQLNAMRADRELVQLPASSALLVNQALPYNRRYCRPTTARFLSDLARVHYARFHRAIQVNSAVRTVAFQRSLMEINGNAAAADGDMASPHLTGAAVDIGKKGLSESEIAWMRAWLLPLQQAGKIDVEEEFYQACFHITVYSSYAPQAMPRVPRRRSSTTLLAAGIR